MFWGVILESGKRYSQCVQNSFHISMAVLDADSTEDSAPVNIMLETEKQEFLLCSLSKKKIPQQVLDLTFQSGEEIAFFTTGQGTVHLTGYLVPEDDMSDVMNSDDESEEEEDDTSALSPAITMNMQASKRKLNKPDGSVNSKKAKVNAQPLSDSILEEEVSEEESDDMLELEESSEEGEGSEVEEEEEEDDDDDEEDEDDEIPTPQKMKLTQSPKKEKQNQTPKKEKQSQTPKEAKTPKQQNKSPKTPNQIGKTPTNGETPNQQSSKKSKKKSLNDTSEGKSPGMVNAKTPNTPGAEVSPQKKVLGAGVTVEDIKVGNGPMAKPGRFVSVYYVGRLKQNNKQFDSAQQGPGFKFKLGANEVIKGWEIGLSGMKVGGKRKIECPPHMAYGKKGSPPVIPPNSTLVFEVELKSVS